MFCIHGSFLYCYFIFQKDGTEIQAFVAECQGQIVGLSVIRREEVIIHLNYSICIFPFCRNLLICVNKRYQYLVYKIYLYFLFMWHFDSMTIHGKYFFTPQNIEYIRSHYNIEDFIYYNHHKREDHGHLHHFALNPIFSHLSKYFIKVSIIYHLM